MVARISKQWFAIRDTYGVEIADGEDWLLLLACVLPLDFVTSYLSNAYLAWSMERNVLLCAAVAAGTNMALNFATIPRYGAIAAALNTLISYVVYLAMLAWAGRSL